MSLSAPDRADDILVAAGLNTFYGPSHVLRDVNFRVGRGETVTLLGRNGMGKTTLIRSIVGFTPPRKGKVIFKGKDVTFLPDFRKMRMGMGLVPQGRWIFPSLTVRENILIGASAGDWNLAEIYKLFPHLEERARH
ncbi:MAG: ATP-binding cassette domain-containing protein, partial [Beijerinckiaceae bacterium]